MPVLFGFVRSKHLGPFTEHAAVAVSPGRGSRAKCDSLQGMPERTSGVMLQSQSSVRGLQIEGKKRRWACIDSGSQK